MSCCHEAPSYTARKQEHLDLKQTAGSWIQALQQLLPLAQVTWLAWSNALCGQEVRKRATFSASRERGSSRTQASWCQGSFIPVHSAAALGARLTTSLIKKKKKKSYCFGQGNQSWGDTEWNFSKDKAGPGCLKIKPIPRYVLSSFVVLELDYIKSCLTWGK